MTIIYQTERLIVRQWQKKDYKDLYEFASDESVTKFLHYKTYDNLQVAKDRISALIERYKSKGVENEYAIALKENDKVIGNINIASYRPKAGGIVSLGYTLNRNFQGKGYATEAVIGCLQYIKKNRIAMRVEATHDIQNFKSGNVLKNAGMTLEGIMRKAGENNFHSRYDVALYSILFEEIKD